MYLTTFHVPNSGRLLAFNLGHRVLIVKLIFDCASISLPQRRSIPSLKINYYNLMIASKIGLSVAIFPGSCHSCLA